MSYEEICTEILEATASSNNIEAGREAIKLLNHYSNSNEQQAEVLYAVAGNCENLMLCLLGLSLGVVNVEQIRRLGQMKAKINITAVREKLETKIGSELALQRAAREFIADFKLNTLRHIRDQYLRPA